MTKKTTPRKKPQASRGHWSKIVNRVVIDIIMYGWLIITLFPIGWMVYSSFKGNSEILIGQIPIGRSSNDCAYSHREGDRLWIGTPAGSLTEFALGTFKPVNYYSTRTLASNYLFGDRQIWVGSADKGLIKLDKNTLKPIKEYALPFEKYDISKVVRALLARDGQKLYCGLVYRGLEKIAVFDLAQEKFTGFIDLTSTLSPIAVQDFRIIGGRLWVASDRGLIEVDLKTQEVSRTKAWPGDLLIGQINAMDFLAPNTLVLGTASGGLLVNIDNLAIAKTIGEKNGLLSPNVVSLLVSGGQVYFGTNYGLSAYDAASGQIQNTEKLFLERSKAAAKKNGPYLPGEVLSIAKSDGQLVLGSSGGRISQMDLAAGRVVQTAQFREGHLMVHWRNYIDLWHNIDFGHYLKNSLIICGLSMLIAMALATTCAYALSRFRFPGNRTFSVAILATQMIPPIMYLIPLYMMFQMLNDVLAIPLKGTYTGMILIYSMFFIPFSIWILRGFFAAIPVELEEAARIDGCSPWKVFLNITLPLAVPGIIATGVYVFLTAWDELMFAWVLTSAKTMTIPVGIRNFVGQYQNRFDLLMAAAVVATLPVIILFSLLQKYIVKGLTAGAVKE